MEEQFGSDRPVYDSYFFMNDGQHVKDTTSPVGACAKVNTLSATLKARYRMVFIT